MCECVCVCVCVHMSCVCVCGKVYGCGLLLVLLKLCTIVARTSMQVRGKGGGCPYNCVLCMQ